MDARRVKWARSLSGLLSIVIAPHALVCAGCLAHADVIWLGEFRGSLIHAESGAGIGHAAVFLTTREQALGNHERMAEGTSAADGRFAIETTIGGGSATWVLFVPVMIQGDRSLPPIETVYLEVVANGKRSQMSLSPGPEAQVVEDGKRYVDLGVIPVEFPREGT